MIEFELFFSQPLREPLDNLHGVTITTLNPACKKEKLDQPSKINEQRLHG